MEASQFYGDLQDVCLKSSMDTNFVNTLTLFENCSKCHIWIFKLWHFPPIFVQLKLACLVTLFDRKLQVFKNSPKLSIFGIFN